MIPDDDTAAETTGEIIEDEYAFTPPPHRDLLVVPESPDAFPEIHQDLVGEAAAMMKVPDHYKTIKPLLDGIASGAFINGGSDWDFKAMIFKFQAEAQANGYTALAKAKAADIGRAFTHAWKRNTGMRLKDLRKQGRQLALEHKQQQRLAAE